VINSLFKQWSAFEKKQQAVLCSVVEWKGSVPRKDYPMMLVLEDGRILGTIGGGSMELKVTRRALEMIDKTGSQLLDFDMTGTDLDGDVGLCGGTLKVLIEPFSKEIETFLDNTMDQMTQNKRVMVQLSIDRQESESVERKIITSRKDIQASEPALVKRIQSLFENQKTGSFDHEGKHYLIWQPFTPPVIHIFGAGHVGQAVAELAHFNELEVAVYDDRMGLLTAARFPYAQRIPLSFPIIWEEFSGPDNDDFVLIASREHKHDRELLRGILNAQPAYVGLVSSARKWRYLAEGLLLDGVDPAAIEKVHAPVGMNIDAQTVPEIAISVLSEIIAEYRRIEA